MTKQEMILNFARVIANEYATSLHLSSLVCLYCVRGARQSWQLLLFLGSILLMIALGGYCLADQARLSISAASDTSNRLVMLQQILLLAYGGIGVGLVSLALTMPDESESNGFWSWLGHNIPVFIVLSVVFSLLFG